MPCAKTLNVWWQEDSKAAASVTLVVFVLFIDPSRVTGSSDSVAILDFGG